MSNRKAGAKLVLILGVLALIVATRFGSAAALATFTRYFCSASVGVFALASTWGLAARLRA